MFFIENEKFHLLSIPIPFCFRRYMYWWHDTKAVHIGLIKPNTLILSKIPLLTLLQEHQLILLNIKSKRMCLSWSQAFMNIKFLWFSSAWVYKVILNMVVEHAYLLLFLFIERNLSLQSAFPSFWCTLTKKNRDTMWDLISCVQSVKGCGWRHHLANLDIFALNKTECKKIVFPLAPLLCLMPSLFCNVYCFQPQSLKL